MNDQEPKVDLNQASKDELMQLKGIGPRMAERIVSARPFQSLQDLKKVSGIGESMLDELKDMATAVPASVELPPALPTSGAENHDEAVVFEAQAATIHQELVPASQSPAPELQDEADLAFASAAEEAEASEEALAVEEQPEPAQDEPQTEAALEFEVEQHSEPEPEPQAEAADQLEPEPETEAPAPATPASRQPRGATRAEAFWMAAAGSFLALVLAVLLSLGVLALINGGISYARPSQLSTLQRQLDSISAEANVLQQDIDGLRTRIGNLEGLSGRVGDLETSSQQMNSDLEAANQRLDQLNQQIDGVTTQINALQKNSDRFQNFLNGLRDLLNSPAQP